MTASRSSPLRTRSSPTPGGDTAGGYVAHMSVEGTDRSAAALKAALLDQIAGTGLFTSAAAGDEQPPADDDVVAHVVDAAYRGSVAHNERMLASATGAAADRVDADGNGWLFFLPFLPFDGASVVRALDILDRIHLATGIRPGSTVNALDADVIDLVVSFPFDRATQVEAFAYLLLRARAAGELAPGTDVRSTTRFLVTLTHGLRVMERTAGRDYLAQVVDQALQGLSCTA
ncbi:hypothetical protein ACFV0H_09555 [Streptomyces erythrochromogenes]|uniref:hypothetical protein n=1 Tax=Streptomyces erythrochromogenes TaxID=285574 RepID=UPI0036CF8523